MMSDLDFECPECGEIFDMIDPIALVSVVCPSCGYNGCKVVLMETDALRAELAQARARLAEAETDFDGSTTSVAV